ncbi:hypothetical protein PHMEG_0008147 [Phytophthora megakarya]|uniref:Uncharacterized protein n=1 Tax=Phytophthora megakarya TaxID=4795 RepID=A0A225WJG4_9STRA|nr:hypothetical protein PHMEG_0008147 [Phytophthora megakarya]
MDDLKYVLKQQEDDWGDDRQSGSSTKTRDFRADNIHQSLLRTKYAGRAYFTQSGDESDSDERHVMFDDETLEISLAQESVESRETPLEIQGAGADQHVLKVMENSGWNKPGHMAHQGKARQSNGHPGSPSLRYDNPDRDSVKIVIALDILLNYARPYKKCGKFHDGRCEDWEMLESIA